MGLGELCEPMQTCNCSNPMKKKTPFVGVFLWGGKLEHAATSCTNYCTRNEEHIYRRNTLLCIIIKLSTLNTSFANVVLLRGHQLVNIDII